MLEQEWTGLDTVAYEALLKIDGPAAESAKQVIEERGAGNTRPVDLDVDYWSDGALSDLRSDLAALLARVRDTGNPLSIEELRRVTEVQVPALETRLSDTVERAQMRLLASQWRVNVAEAVAHTLNEIADYRVEDSLWERLETRRTFMAKLQRDDGNEIIVSVARRPTTTASACWPAVLRLRHHRAGRNSTSAPTRSQRDCAPVASRRPTRAARAASPIPSCSTSSASATRRSPRRGERQRTAGRAESRRRSPGGRLRPGVTDAFIGTDYIKRWIDEELCEQLQAEGFQRVVLSSNHRGLVLL